MMLRTSIKGNETVSTQLIGTKHVFINDATKNYITDHWEGEIGSGSHNHLIVYWGRESSSLIQLVQFMYIKYSSANQVSSLQLERHLYSECAWSMNDKLPLCPQMVLSKVGHRDMELRHDPTKSMSNLRSLLVSNLLCWDKTVTSKQT